MYYTTYIKKNVLYWKNNDRRKLVTKKILYHRFFILVSYLNKLIMKCWINNNKYKGSNKKKQNKYKNESQTRVNKFVRYAIPKKKKLR